ncbi:Mfa1 family fimbria major subunit, partial [Parabacteroides sp.]
MSLISLALVACSSDEDLKQTTGQDQAGEALVSLKLDVARAQTKGSPGATNKQEGTEDESKINNLTVVVVYEDGTKVVVSKDDLGVGWNDNMITFKAPEGPANFYVYANAHEGDIPDDSWNEELQSSTEDEGVSGYYDASNGFFMSNQNGDPKSYPINAAAVNELTVPIERAAAKVTVEYSEGSSTEKYGGELSGVKFALGNIADRFFLLEQSSEEGGYVMPGELKYDQTDILNDSDWLNASEDAFDSDNIETLEGAYCAENISKENKEKMNTYVKFQTTFKPSKRLELVSITADSDDNTFKVTSTEVEDMTAQDAETFYVVLESDEGWTSSYIMESELFDSPAGDDPKEGITFDLEESEDYIKVKGIKGITRLSLPYTNGTCYFGPIWFNLADDGKSSPVYRNDWYHLKINSIKLPGSPKEPTAETEDPLVPDVDVNLTVKVLNWNWVPKEIDLQ